MHLVPDSFYDHSHGYELCVNGETEYYEEDIPFPPLDVVKDVLAEHSHRHLVSPKVLDIKVWFGVWLGKY